MFQCFCLYNKSQLRAAELTKTVSASVMARFDGVCSWAQHG